MEEYYKGPSFLKKKPVQTALGVGADPDYQKPRPAIGGVPSRLIKYPKKVVPALGAPVNPLWNENPDASASEPSEWEEDGATIKRASASDPGYSPGAGYAQADKAEAGAILLSRQGGEEESDYLGARQGTLSGSPVGDEDQLLKKSSSIFLR